MSSTIAISSPSRRDHRPQYSAERTRSDVSRRAATKERPPTTRKRAPFKRRVTRAIERFEEWMHYSIATVLSGIAIATMAYTTVSLLTSSDSFAAATSNAVAGVLIVLILIEITRTVVTPPDSKGVAIRRLLMIAIMSALREVLWIGIAGNTKTEIDKPLAMAISTIVVVGLAVAFVLVRRASGEKTG
jgi:uncharacterized membrane protein (DUF373 family)